MHTVHSMLDRARNFNTSDLQDENRIDDTGVMIVEAPQGWSAVPCHLHVYVPDVDAI